MHPPPGKIIEVDGCRLHLYDQGQGHPTVVLEAGLAGSLLGWSLVQPKVAEFARVCSYDRAGLGWSEKCATPRTVPQMVSELATLLRNAHVPGPYILVGHSFGGLLIRAYAHLRPDEVAGLVFVDPVSLDAWAGCDPYQVRRLKTGARLARRGAILAKLGVVSLALSTLASGGRRFPKLVAKASAGAGTNAIERLTGEVRRLPPEVWPMIRAHWSQPKCFQAMAEYIECLPAAAAFARSLALSAELPIAILSAATATQAEMEERDGWISYSTRGRHVRVENSAHWIQLEQPETVVSAVRQILVDTQNRKPSAAEAAEGS